LAASLPYVIYSDSYDHRCYVRGLVNESFSGLLWTPEVRDASSIEDLYRRLETVIFSPEALINCWYIKNPPWMQIDKDKNNRNEWMPDHEQVTDAIRKLLQLRMSFVPYLYSAFNEYHLKGIPPIRALVLDWPDDPAVREIDDQYMFGASVMVAPLFAGQKSRSVYLPAGDWYDFWTHQKYVGGQTIEVTNDLEQIPLFVKGGTLLPLSKPVEHISADTVFDITVYAFGSQPANFVLYEDDSVSNDFATGKQNQIRLHWDNRGHSVRRPGRYHGRLRYRIVDWKRYAAAKGPDLPGNPPAGSELKRTANSHSAATEQLNTWTDARAARELRQNIGAAAAPGAGRRSVERPAKTTINRVLSGTGRSLCDASPPPTT
jgi:alpha-D-xyloside xylohydrolase